MAPADPLDRTVERIIEAAVEFYRDQQDRDRTDPEVYAYFDDLVRELRRPSR